MFSRLKELIKKTHHQIIFLNIHIKIYHGKILLLWVEREDSKNLKRRKREEKEILYIEGLYKESAIRIISEYLTVTLETRRLWNDVFQILKKNYFQLLFYAI